MRASRRRGFTLVEMMVALVAAGILMASLVGLSASVQRSFGYSKEITELQGNLRFAMKTLVDDLGRVSFMHSPDPDVDCHRSGPSPGGLSSLEYNGSVLSLRGNFVSARDYLLDMQNGIIVCRNTMNGAVSEMAGLCGGYEPYLAPFADGPDNVADVFCPGQWVRLETEPRKFQYLQVNAVSPANNGLLLNLANYSFNENTGYFHFVSPITLVQYSLQQDGAYVAPYSTPSAAGRRWRLLRQYDGCQNGVLTWGTPIELADFLLPPDPALPSGFALEFIEDSNAANVVACSPNAAPPVFSPWTPLVAAGQTTPARVRAFTVTLRGRTVSEDPAYMLPGLAGNPTLWMNYGVDLDGKPDNGLAYVRAERTVIQLRNLSLNLTL